MTFTILTEDGAFETASTRLGAAELAAATGWELKPEGLCRGAVCVPVRDRDDLADRAISIEAFGLALNRPVVVDEAAGVAAIGADPVEVGAALRARVAADFTLPTLDGAPFTFSSLGRRKKLLVAWASW